MLRVLLAYLCRPLIHYNISGPGSSQWGTNPFQGTGKLTAPQATAASSAPPTTNKPDATQEFTQTLLTTRIEKASPNAQAIKKELGTINTAIDGAQAKIRSGTATPTELVAAFKTLSTGIEALKTLLKKVEANNQPGGDNSSALDAKIDLDKPISVKVFQKAFDTLANEEGEVGRLQLKVGAEAGIGIARVGAEFMAGMEYAKDDDGKVNLSIDLTFAAKAGFDIGILEGGVVVGGGQKMTLQFNNSQDAAAFMVDTLKKLNTEAGVDAFDIAPESVPFKKPTVIVENSGFIALEATAKLPFKGEISGEVRQTHMGRTYTNPDGTKATGFTDKSSVAMSMNLEVGHHELAISAEVARVTEKKPGKKLEESVEATVSINLSALKKMSPGDLSKGLTQLAEKMNIPAGQMGAFLTGMTETVSKTHLAGPSVALVVDVKMAEGDKPGSWKLDYARVSVKTEYTAKLNIDAKLAELKVEAVASKKEVVLEIKR